MGIDYRQPFNQTRTRINSCVPFFFFQEKKQFRKSRPSKLAAPCCLCFFWRLFYLNAATGQKRPGTCSAWEILVPPHVHGHRGVCSRAPLETETCRSTHSSVTFFFFFRFPLHQVAHSVSPCAGHQWPFLAGDLQLFKTSVFFLSFGYLDLAPWTEISQQWGGLRCLSFVMTCQARVSPCLLGRVSPSILVSHGVPNLGSVGLSLASVGSLPMSFVPSSLSFNVLTLEHERLLSAKPAKGPFPDETGHLPTCHYTRDYLHSVILLSTCGVAGLT